MKAFRYFMVLIFVCYILPYKLFAQNISNEGTEFWAAFPTHVPSSNGPLANMNIVVTSKANTEVTVSCGSYTEKKAVPANTAVEFEVPRLNSYINDTEANSIITNRGIRIVVSSNLPPVSVYGHVYAGTRSAATLILPFKALGQKYYSMNFTQSTGGRNFLMMVAVEDNTVLRLTKKDASVQVITLPKTGDVYEYLVPNGEDITGVDVQVDPTTSQCKRFAAFSGSTNMTIVCSGSSDPLIQQLYPTNSWGKNYGIVPFINRRYKFRILAQEDNTKVSINNNPTPIILSKGIPYESADVTEGVIITADKLISVAQYSLTQTCSSINGGSLLGDPDMVLLNPIEFNIRKITLFSSDKLNITEKYLNVMMKTDSRGTFKVNGAAPTNGTWLTFSSNPVYSYIQIRIPNVGGQSLSSITLTAEDGFNAISYGYGSFESYAYSAGTSLADNQYLTVVNTLAQTTKTNACVNETETIKATIPYLLNRALWQFDDGTPNYDDTGPQPIVRVVNGQTLYDYVLPIGKTYNTVGQKNIKVTGFFTVASNTCFAGNADFEFTLNVEPKPTAKFSTIASSCVGSEVLFTDESLTNSQEKAISKWTWDFGDGSLVSAEKNPKHTYKTAGVFTVKLIVAADNGCNSEVFSKEIYVNTLPVAKFLAKPSLCEKQVIKFEDQSTSTEGNIVTWRWEFGDGHTSTERHPEHVYTAAGNYNVKLTVTSEIGCEKTSVQQIKINVLPIVDFETPGFCLADASAKFINKSEVTSTEPLTYLWDFGDAFASAQRPNTSTARDGIHTFTQTGIYEITLTVKSVSGCVVVVKKQFRVNGSTPIAKFEVQNESNLCSNNLVIFKDKATVDFGEITKVIWYFDYANKTTPDLIDEEPNLRADLPKEYSFKYPTFSDVANKNYTVKMVAYSGTSCVSTADKTIILKALPDIEFAPTFEVCSNAPTIQLVAYERNEMPGSGVFSGNGVDANGIFNPLRAGIGVHSIKYLFTPNNGCPEEKIQLVTVNETPTVDAGEDKTVLEGGQTTLTATAHGGQNLTYKWTPTTGLDRDDVLNPTVRPTEDITYTLTVKGDKECFGKDQVKVKVMKSLVVPNTITPNGDRVNDEWNIKYLDSYPSANVEIFDRAGQNVFRSKGYLKPFDGTFNNNPLPVGTYYYIINLAVGKKPTTGTLTIIR